MNVDIEKVKFQQGFALVDPCVTGAQDACHVYLHTVCTAFPENRFCITNQILANLQNVEFANVASVERNIKKDGATNAFHFHPEN